MFDELTAAPRRAVDLATLGVARAFEGTRALPAAPREAEDLTGPVGALVTTLLRPVQTLLRARFRACVEGGLAEEFLELLLRTMQVALVLDPRFGRLVEGFDGRYAFRARDGTLKVCAVFSDGRLRVWEGDIDDPHITVTFASGRALCRFLLSANPDVLLATLRHEVEPLGNLNYLYRLAYLARHLQRAVTKG